MNVPPAILVVDDDEDIRDVLRIVLEAVGYPVATARDGLEALGVLEGDDRIALILLDLMMPRCDGQQFLAEVRAQRALRVPPVVVMSGHAGAVAQAREMEANACLTKPVDLDKLLATVDRFVAAPGPV